MIVASLFVSVSAGTVHFNLWTVYAFNASGTTGGLKTTTTSTKCITAGLNQRGNTKDKVKMWVVEFYSEQAKCDGITVVEGGSAITSNNYNNISYGAGNYIMIRYKNANGDWNLDYTIAGYATYY